MERKQRVASVADRIPVVSRESCEEEVGDCYQLYELGSLDHQPNVHNGAIQERNCD